MQGAIGDSPLFIGLYSDDTVISCSDGSRDAALKILQNSLDKFSHGVKAMP